MANDLDELEKKLRKAENLILDGRKDDDKTKSSRLGLGKISGAMKSDGAQAGTEFIGSIVLPTGLGYVLDSYFDTLPLFFLGFFFIGICLAFYVVFKISQGIDSAVGYKENANKTENTEKKPLSDKTNQSTDTENS